DAVALTGLNDAPNANVPLEIRASRVVIPWDNVCLALGTVPAPAYQLQLSIDSAAKPGSSTWTVPSGAAMKQHVKNLDGGLDIINRLRPTEAEYNGLGGTPEGIRVVSLIAEELAKVLPHAVETHRGKLRAEDSDDSDLLGVNFHEVLLHLILAVQQLSARLER